MTWKSDVLTTRPQCPRGSEKDAVGHMQMGEQLDMELLTAAYEEREIGIENEDDEFV